MQDQTQQVISSIMKRPGTCPTLKLIAIATVLGNDNADDIRKATSLSRATVYRYIRGARQIISETVHVLATQDQSRAGYTGTDETFILTTETKSSTDETTWPTTHLPPLKGGGGGIVTSTDETARTHETYSAYVEKRRKIHVEALRAQWEIFFSMYPSHRASDSDANKRLFAKMSENERNEMVSALSIWAKSGEWKENNQAYVPSMTRFLEGWWRGRSPQVRERTWVG